MAGQCQVDESRHDQRVMWCDERVDMWHISVGQTDKMECKQPAGPLPPSVLDKLYPFKQVYSVRPLENIFPDSLLMCREM